MWAYTGASNTKRWFPRKHDTILFYAKTGEARFNRDAVRIPYSGSFMKRRKYTDRSKAGQAALNAQRNEPKKKLARSSVVGR